jgi:triacylglycerol lipase
MRYLYQWLIELLLVLLYLPISILRLLMPIKKLNSRVTKSSPIVIVEHWFSQNPYHLLMKLYLERKGFKVYMLNYSILKNDFHTSARKLARFINQRHLRGITLVGISFGGIDGYYYLQKLGGYSKVKRFISIGTPFKGTPWAYFPFMFKSCQQMFPGSEFVKFLNSEPAKYPQKIITLSARFDEMVPAQSSRLPKVSNKTINTVGHNKLHIISKGTFTTIPSLAD